MMNKVMMILFIIYGLWIIIVDAVGRNFSPVTHMLPDSADRGIAMNRLMMICVIIYGLGIIFVDAPGRNYSPVKNLVSDTDPPTHTAGPAGTFASVCDASLMSLVFGDSMTSALSDKMSRPPAAPRRPPPPPASTPPLPPPPTLPASTPPPCICQCIFPLPPPVFPPSVFPPVVFPPPPPDTFPGKGLMFMGVGVLLIGIQIGVLAIYRVVKEPRGPRGPSEPHLPEQHPSEPHPPEQHPSEPHLQEPASESSPGDEEAAHIEVAGRRSGLCSWMFEGRYTLTRGNGRLWRVVQRSVSAGVWWYEL